LPHFLIIMHAIDHSAVSDLFKRHFNFRPAFVTRAPATVELLGGLAESNEGLAMTVAADRYAFVAASPRTDGRIELVHADRAPETFWITDPRDSAAAPWADPFKAVLRELHQRKVHFSGFSAALHNEIPEGLGLGEAAAGAVAAALMVRKLFPFGLGETGATEPPKRDSMGAVPPLAPPERLHFARVCGAALTVAGQDDDGFVPSISALAGRAWKVLHLDCRFNSLELSPFAGTAVILCDSGVRRPDSLVMDTEVLDCCAAAARRLSVRSLRSLEAKTLRASKAKLDQREFECAMHVVGEIQRVAGAERALREDDHRQMGGFLTLSHESLRENLRASCPELDLLVELACAQTGCHGARALGPGHGGATVNLVSYHEAEPFLANMARAYEQKTGRKLKPVVCQIVDGAE
jgi:galactokinase